MKTPEEIHEKFMAMVKLDVPGDICVAVAERMNVEAFAERKAKLAPARRRRRMMAKRRR